MLPWLDLLLLKSSHRPAPCLGCERAGAMGTACCRASVSAGLPWSWHTLSSMAWRCSWPGRWVSWALILALLWDLGQLTSPLCVPVAPPERALWALLEHLESRTLPQLTCSLSSGARRALTINCCLPEWLLRAWLNKLIATCF